MQKLPGGLVVPDSVDIRPYYREKMREGLPLTVRDSKFLNQDCLECHQPRFGIGSRYCERCHTYFRTREQEDIASGKNKDKNYGYSLEGWNNGLNAWVWNRESFAKLEKLARLEGVESVG